MEIQTKTSSVQLNAYLKQVRNQPQPSDARPHQESSRPAAGSDKVELSARAREVQQAVQTLKAMPDTRPEKVAQVKMDVEQGTYKVAGAQIATRMMRESFENDTILQKITNNG